MSNRRRPRISRDTARRIARCPDCNSTVTVTGPGRVRVEHDLTCPWYRRFGNGRGFTAVRLVPLAPAGDAE
jgi:hypothetical protein